MIRAVVEFLLLAFVTRAIWLLIGGVIQGLASPAAAPRSPARSARMVRDPVCGTFVLPERAIKLTTGREDRFFCSTACRDMYRAKGSMAHVGSPHSAVRQGGKS